jgi:hypothetical protein
MSSRKKIKKMLTFYFQSDQFGVNLFKKNIFGKKKMTQNR